MAEVISPIEPDHLSLVRQFVVLSAQINDLSKKRDELKDTLMGVVEILGEPDGNGHIYLDLPREIGGFAGFQRQRRVTRTLDEEAAGKILELRKLTARCMTTIEVVDEEEVMAALLEERLTESDVDAMYPPRVSHAFVPIKAGKRR